MGRPITQAYHTKPQELLKERSKTQMQFWDNTLVYNLVCARGPPHDPTYSYQVRCSHELTIYNILHPVLLDGMTSLGTAGSKQKAKDRAARCMLDKV